MTDPRDEPEDAREAREVGEKPDLGHTADALKAALTGTDSGSDTRAGSLQGGAATGSDDDPDQDIINETLATEGMKAADIDPKPPGAGKDVDQPGDDVDAPTG
ncbi:MAG: ribonuclease [Brevundimonas sp.]|uniref:ribonuclease n=1 Tax=Brevundimonas sp. TaxID=1871086 RepID=UPI0011F815DD|nr:ribonuclease [Brevundimonas sp.]RZJ18906.1 MAG: ribonuclease [Brevundimonas sp.]